MKHQHQIFDKNFQLLKTILRLRYGNENPNQDDHSYFSYGVIAKYLKKDSKLVTKLAYKYFKDRSNNIKKISLSSEMINYLISHDYLESNATKSLQ